MPQVTLSSCLGSFPSCWKLWRGCACTCLCVAVCLRQRWAVFHCCDSYYRSCVYLCDSMSLGQLGVGMIHLV